MPRHADVDWNLPTPSRDDEGVRRHSWDSIHAALLMDLRDRLDVLRCPDFKRIPYTLELIERHLRPKRQAKPLRVVLHLAAVRRARARSRAA